MSDTIDGFVRDLPVPGNIFDSELFLTTFTFDRLKAENTQRWSAMVIRTDKREAVAQQVRSIASHKDRYSVVAATTKVPWHVIGILHSKEAGLNFNTHLHNGDPLSARTVHVPAGRPVSGTPPFTWEESAIDALALDGLSSNNDWSVERLAFLLERFNGIGYREQNPPIATPYLWNFSNQYIKGLFVKDGVFDPNKVGQNCGAMPLLRQMIDTGLA